MKNLSISLIALLTLFSIQNVSAIDFLDSVGDSLNSMVSGSDKKTNEKKGADGATKTKKLNKGQIQILSVAPYGKETFVPPAVRNECKLNSKLMKFTKEYAQDSVVVVDKLNLKKGPILKIEITNVHGSGGGAWSGGKSVSIKGTLNYKNGSKKSFEASRYSGGGAFASFKGTCSILGRCTKTLGKDVAAWLKNPVNNAQLGDGINR